MHQPVTITTKDIEIWAAPDFDSIFSLNYVSEADQTALLLCGERKYKSKKYAMAEERQRKRDGRGWEYIKRPITEEEYETYRFCKPKGISFYGFEYNVLDCLVQLLNDLPRDSKIVAAPGGEAIMNKLYDIMDVTKPYWMQQKPINPNKQFIDRVKVKFKKQIDNICKEKNILIDLKPYYFIVKRIKKIGEQTYTIIKRWEGDEILCTRPVYLVEFADGRVKKDYGRPAEDERAYCVKFGLPLCEIEND
jgi:hypothetical protein